METGIGRFPTKSAGWRKRFALIIIALVVLAIAACSGISIFVGWSLTHPLRKPLDDSPDHYGIAYDSVEFPSRQGGIVLKGWFLHAAKPGGTTLIMAHGYSGNRLEKGLPALSLAKSLTEAGYPVLMFDFRNSGESGGKLTSVGYYEQEDLLGAVDWVKDHFPGRIGLIGFSMGGTTALLAAAREPDIVGVVADSPFSNLKTYLQANLPVWSHLPAFPFTPLIMTLLPPATGIRPEKVDALSAVDRIYPRPVLFIHSRDDKAIPYTESRKLWEKHKDRFIYWETSKAGHVGSYALQPEEYANRVLAFFGGIR